MSLIYDDLCELGLNRVRQLENKVMTNWAITGEIDHTVILEDGIEEGTARLIANGAPRHTSSHLLENIAKEDYYGSNSN